MVSDDLLPPGPRAPRAVQTAGFVLGGLRFLEWCRRRYGDAVTFRTLFGPEWVMVFDPALVKDVFQGPATQLHAGEANAMLGPVVGRRSPLTAGLRTGARRRRRAALRRDRPAPRGFGSLGPRRRVLGAAPDRDVRRRGARRARDAAARRPRDDRHRPRLGVRPAPARA